MKVKRIAALIMCAILAAGFLCPSFAADVGNNTGVGDVTVPGAAASGNAAWPDSQSATMWKVTFYVAADETCSFSDEAVTSAQSNPLFSKSLTDDFYKFGKTFWLYEGTGEDGQVTSLYQMKKSEYASRFWFAVSCKEDYVGSAGKMAKPGGNLGFTMTSSDVLGDRLFDVRELGGFEAVSKNGYPPKDGRQIILPYVRNVRSNSAYNSTSTYDDAVSFFFGSSIKNWNRLLDLAAITEGCSDYTQLLRRMVDERKFTYNGTAVTCLDDVDPGRKQNPAILGRWNDETSQVAWVLVFEPVIIFYKYLSNGYNYYVMSVSDAAASMISGSIALTLTYGTDGYTMVNGVSNAKYLAPESVRNRLSSWAFISPFFMNLGKAVTVKYPWLGYRPLEDSDYMSLSQGLLFYDRAMLYAGVGFRYQAGGKVPPQTGSKVSIVIEKVFSDGGTDFGNVAFSVAGVNAAFKNVTPAVSLAKALALTAGTPSSAGTSYTEQQTYGSETVSLKYEKKLLYDGRIAAVCTLELPADANGRSKWKITETTRPASYPVVRLTSPTGVISYADSLSVQCEKGNSYSVRCENIKAAPLTVTKSITDANGNASDNYSEIAFVVTGAETSNRSYDTLAFDGEGNLISLTYTISGGSINLVRPKLYGDDGTDLTINGFPPSGVSVTKEQEAGRMKLTVNGLPDGVWNIREYFASSEASQRCTRTVVRQGERASAVYFASSESTSITLNKSSVTSLAGNGGNNYVYFENTVATDLIDVGLEEVQPDAEYVEGTYVVSSFKVFNYSEKNILPAEGLDVMFYAYVYENGVQVEIASDVMKDIPLPRKENTFVWFKWKVPEGLSGKQVFCTATVNPSRTIGESDYLNNGGMIINLISQPDRSATPDTYYEREKPYYFNADAVPPSGEIRTGEWYVWNYMEGLFWKSVFKVYALTDPQIEITPVSELTPAESVIRSGNGFELSVSVPIGYSALGASSVPEDSYTGVQSVKVYLPEFNYSAKNGSFRTLEATQPYSPGNTLSVFEFEENSCADGNKRVHFIPVWFPDGDYTVSILASDIWTPAGMLSASFTKSITVDGDAYDGWYTRR